MLDAAWLYSPRVPTPLVCLAAMRTSPHGKTMTAFATKRTAAGRRQWAMQGAGSLQAYAAGLTRSPTLQPGATAPAGISRQRCQLQSWCKFRRSVRRRATHPSESPWARGSHRSPALHSRRRPTLNRRRRACRSVGALLRGPPPARSVELLAAFGEHRGCRRRAATCRQGQPGSGLSRTKRTVISVT